MAVFLPPAAAHLAKVAARDDGRYASAIRVIDPRNGTYRVEATDGRRAIILRGNNMPAELAPMPRGVKDPVPEALVPVEGWLAGFKMVPRADWRNVYPLGMKLGRHEIRMATYGAQRTCQPVEGKWPPIDNVIPNRPALLAFDVNPVMLAEMLQAARVFLDAETPRVTIHFYGKGHPVGVSCKTGEYGGVFFDGLIMPLT